MIGLDTAGILLSLVMFVIVGIVSLGLFGDEDE